MTIPFVPKAILFDMDGVLFNTEDLAHDLFQMIAKRFDSVFTEEDHQTICGTPERFWSHYLNTKWNTAITEAEFASQFWKELRFLEETNVVLLENVKNCFEYLQSKEICMAVVTSTPRKLTEELLNQFSLMNYFTVLITGDEIVNGKPNPEPYQNAIRQLGLIASDCIVIEDALSGVRSGKAAGCFVVAIPTAHTIGLDYSEADLVVQNLNEFQKVIS